MTLPVAIDSAADPRLADYVGLRDPDLRVRVERSGGFFIGEGELVVRRMIERGCELRSVLVTPRRYEALRSALDQVTCPVFVAPDATLHEVAGFHLHRGVVAAAARPPRPSPGALLASSATRTVVAFECVNDHENLGSAFRSGAALGADAILLCPQCSDPLYRRTVRVSMGQVLAVPWAVTGPWPAALDELRSAGFVVAALTPGGDTDLGSWRPERQQRLALLLGAEGPGLTAAALASADVWLRIPMRHGVDSLNVAVAMAVALHDLRPDAFRTAPA